MTGRHATQPEDARLTVTFVSDDLTPGQADKLGRAFDDVMRTSAGRWSLMQSRALRRTLPARIRARLWATRRIDGAAIWLVDHGHVDAARALWRAAGMWRGK